MLIYTPLKRPQQYDRGQELIQKIVVEAEEEEEEEGEEEVGEEED
jgi:hypothetical protein